MNNQASNDFNGSPSELRNGGVDRSKQYIPQWQGEDDTSRFFLSNSHETLKIIAVYMAFTGEEVTLSKIQQPLLSGQDVLAEMYSDVAEQMEGPTNRRIDPSGQLNEPIRKLLSGAITSLGGAPK